MWVAGTPCDTVYVDTCDSNYVRCFFTPYHGIALWMVRGQRREGGVVNRPALTFAGRQLPRERPAYAIPTSQQNISRVQWNFTKQFSYWNKWASTVKSLWNNNVQCSTSYALNWTSVSLLSEFSLGKRWQLECLCFSRSLVGEAVVSAPPWRPTSTSRTTWRTSGRRTSTRWVDLAAISVIAQTRTLYFRKTIVPTYLVAVDPVLGESCMTFQYRRFLLTISSKYLLVARITVKVRISDKVVVLITGDRYLPR